MPSSQCSVGLGMSGVCNTHSVFPLLGCSARSRRRILPLRQRQQLAGSRLRAGGSFSLSFRRGHPATGPAFSASRCVRIRAQLSDGLGADVQGSKPAAGAEPGDGVEQRWRLFFSNPNQWWDDRYKKRSPTDPDFVKKGTRETLWIDSSTPAWVQQELAKLPAQPRPAPRGPPPPSRQGQGYGSSPPSTGPYRPPGGGAGAGSGGSGSFGYGGGRYNTRDTRPQVSEAEQAAREERARQILASPIGGSGKPVDPNDTQEARDARAKEILERPIGGYRERVQPTVSLGAKPGTKPVMSAEERMAREERARQIVACVPGTMPPAWPPEPDEYPELIALAKARQDKEQEEREKRAKEILESPIGGRRDRVQPTVSLGAKVPPKPVMSPEERMAREERARQIVACVPGTYPPAWPPEPHEYPELIALAKKREEERRAGGGFRGERVQPTVSLGIKPPLTPEQRAAREERARQILATPPGTAPPAWPPESESQSELNSPPSSTAAEGS